VYVHTGAQNDREAIDGEKSEEVEESKTGSQESSGPQESPRRSKKERCEEEHRPQVQGPEVRPQVRATQSGAAASRPVEHGHKHVRAQP
jgi:hypothetical protein